jgi:hypothetical protein
MTDSALRKWLKIRAKYDPKELFTGHHGFDRVLPENQVNGDIEKPDNGQS